MVGINRILCAVDFSEFSRDALQHGLVLARWYAAQLTILHVYEADRPLMGLPGETFVPPVAADQVARHVGRFCAPVLESAALEAEVVVREGNPAKEITQEAEHLPADVLIMGTHGRSGFERLVLGSVTEKVLRTTRVPVLTIPPPVQQPGLPVFRTILCPVDFSDASLRALEYALSLARAAEARVILLHVIEDAGSADAETFRHLTVWEYYQHVEQDALAGLRQLLSSDDAPVPSRRDERVVRGQPSREILKVVADEPVDLIVMGVQGRHALSQWMFGSTTHAVIRQARCPVLTLHRESVAVDLTGPARHHAARASLSEDAR